MRIDGPDKGYLGHCWRVVQRLQRGGWGGGRHGRGSDRGRHRLHCLRSGLIGLRASIRRVCSGRGVVWCDMRRGNRILERRRWVVWD